MPSPAEPARLLLGTRSADKVREIRQILAARPGFHLLGLDDIGLPRSPDEDAIESFDTFHESAIAKALFYAERSGLPTLADDSGLAVDALGGAPGVRSKRFSGRADLAGRALDDANNTLLLQRLAGVPADRRTARYVCVAALAFPQRPAFAAIGTCTGLIAGSPRGHGGFGYDPLFLLPDLGATFAELPPGEKHRRSHRARAFQALAAHLPAAWVTP